MSGTKEGGRLAAITNKELYGANFYKEMGRLGGKAPYHGKKGFANNRELARIAGKKGGTISKRRKAQPVSYKMRVTLAEEPRYIKTSLWKNIKGRIK